MRIGKIWQVCGALQSIDVCGGEEKASFFNDLFLRYPA